IDLAVAIQRSQHMRESVRIFGSISSGHSFIFGFPDKKSRLSTITRARKGSYPTMQQLAFVYNQVRAVAYGGDRAGPRKEEEVRTEQLNRRIVDMAFERRTRSAHRFVALVAFCLLTGCYACIRFSTAAADDYTVKPAVAEQTTEEAGAIAAFNAAYLVFSHPRCVNCHPSGNAPLQGDDGHPHAFRVQRGTDGAGIAAE